MGLAQLLHKKKINVTLSSNVPKKSVINGIKIIPIGEIKQNSLLYDFDVIISSNDARIFDYYSNSKKILWLHNPLQIEKSIRKKQFFPIIKNNLTAVFVSKYLNKTTSKFYFFKKRLVIPNFLTSVFTQKNLFTKREPIFVWSVQRNKGLTETIDMWINKINPFFHDAKFYILGVERLPIKYGYGFLKSKNITHIGRVSKQRLKNIYNKSIGMVCLGYDETFCLNALEANSCGLPVITFGKTALNDLIKNNYNGFKVNNFENLSNKIRYLLELNKNKKKKLINNSITHSKKFSLNIIIYKWLKLLK
jgi:glycosyltransferase involved in cell wall biosynthesis